MKNVVVLFCNDNMFNNSSYIQKGMKTIMELRKIGNYKGDIVLFHTEEFDYLEYIQEAFDVILHKVSPLDLSNVHNYLNNQVNVEFHSKMKYFWFNKFYIFHTFFKTWEKVLYIDCGTHIYQDINSIFDLDCSNSIIAHSGLYPDSYGKFTLLENFEERNNDIYLQTLKNSYDIIKPDYFLSGFLLFDTNIIEPDTFDNLVDLMNRFPCSKGDQGILNLYFYVIKNIWKVLPEYIFAFCEKDNKQPNDYIMLKYPKS